MYVLSLPALRAPPLAKEVAGVANEDENAKKATKRRRLNNISGMSWISSTSSSARTHGRTYATFSHPFQTLK
jgi:hypothetical protein